MVDPHSASIYGQSCRVLFGLDGMLISISSRGREPVAAGENRSSDTWWGSYRLLTRTKLAESFPGLNEPGFVLDTLPTGDEDEEKDCSAPARLHHRY